MVERLSKVDRVDLQNSEFLAADAFAEALQRHNSTAVVDNDYPAARHAYEGALADLIRAMKANDRFAPGTRYGMPTGLNFSGVVSSRTLHFLCNARATLNAAIGVIDERANQDAKWGESNHPDLPASVKHPCAFFGIPTADAARLFCETAFRTGTGSNAHILLEEVSEAIEAANDPAHLREELVQVAAVAMKWIEQIDRRTAVAHAEVSHG